ncbi:MAG: lactate racemase domain-containing protein [Candidatus Marinimicrobia bacterium]|nr:lactate racemase domain-containing protein [Candidatus Neomarinimicrobiota bacterium]MCF7827384.1 lactate racemase domain-containing protein [Candidatus Neomarinimicrobiota bacterium]MCF7881383.1 lactate racemase domain-containing protein [Candidatus Neomarinimicrobiota bacterium]
MHDEGTRDRLLPPSQIKSILEDSFNQNQFSGKRILFLIPDTTRSGPVDLLFRQLHEVLGERAAALDFLIALGTHPPISDEQIFNHLGITAEEYNTTYENVTVFNHRWDKPDTFTTIGTISPEEIVELSNGQLETEVPVRLNKMIFDYDYVVVCGPVFPHEVVGFSGGNKYFFPGISGQEVIDFTHWLGALITSRKIIGTKDTPVRAVIDRAASFIDVPKLSICYVVEGEEIAGLYVDAPEKAWSDAADLSAKTHIKYVDHQYRQVLSIIPEMYDDIWTGAKGMYKMEPVIADGGEVILYAPHISEFSYTHGDRIEKVGYHVKDYFVKQWDKFRDKRWGVLAHSTHLRGAGEYDAATGREKPRITVTLATRISQERCEQANLGYRDPDEIDLAEWHSKDGEDVLVVPKAGELLYRLN